MLVSEYCYKRLAIFWHSGDIDQSHDINNCCGFQTFSHCYSLKSGTEMAPVVHGLSNKVRSTFSPKFYAFGLFILGFVIFAIIHQ